jgi:hypothetical protein
MANSPDISNFNEICSGMDAWKIICMALYGRNFVRNENDNGDLMTNCNANPSYRNIVTYVEMFIGYME